MKAVIFEKYGPPEVLKLTDIEKPTPKDNELLIRVHATTVTAGDVRVRRADPFLVRLFFGLRAPKKQILGTELSGVVEAVGKDVSGFKEGDRVYAFTGGNMGAYVEYICMPEEGPVIHVPDSIPLEEAAGLGFGGTASLFFLKEQGQIQPGHHVLIYGASGALGTAAVQLAKYFGAEVTAVCSTKNIDLVRSLGADHVVDYTREDFTRNGQHYDIIFDTVGKSALERAIRSLKPQGRFLGAVHIAPGKMARGLWTSLTSSKKVLGGVAPERKEDLIFLRDLMIEGKLSVVIDHTYPVQNIVEAHRRVDAGHKRGNVIVSWKEVDSATTHSQQAHSQAH